MVDLGIYNFIKNTLAQGKSEAEITQILTARNLSAKEIEDTLTAVKTNAAPPLPTPRLYAPLATPPQEIEKHTSAIPIITFLVIAVIVGGFYFVPKPEIDDLYRNGFVYLQNLGWLGNTAESLPQNPPTAVGSGWKEYRNAEYHFSLRFPDTLNATLSVRGAKSYSTDINAGSAHHPPFLYIFIIDEHDTQTSDTRLIEKLTPPAHVVGSLTGGGLTYTMGDNSDPLGSVTEIVAEPTVATGVLPGNSYVLYFSLEPVAVADLPAYHNLIRQIVSSITFY